ncbi:MAG: hypothetical protein A2583_12390 [Bdellovibrionales bacterium RIFOXYD1_FULL_53_11]|nr:MAG: hypothetical protein A2583_12390 [Bdellovibrionales bacterium RIFOXYD1_FULL_53_11]
MVLAVGMAGFMASSSAFAKVRLPVVLDYKKAENKKIFRFTSYKDVPKQLVSEAAMPNPDRAYSGPFNNIFLQNRFLIVCFKTCSSDELNLQPKAEGDDFRASLKGKNKKTRRAWIQQATVYYWVTRLFEKMESFGFTPKKRITIYVGRNVIDPGEGDVMRNNAFFNREDWSISMLPSRPSLLMWLIGKSMRHTAYDPAVSLHEAGHAIFEEITGQYVNREMMGLHEAFADYASMSMLDHPGVGLVAMGGKTLRDARKSPKSTSVPAKIESHKLGHMIVHHLWKCRELLTDKLLADRIAFETMKRIGQNIYSTVWDVERFYVEAFKELAAGGTQAGLQGAVEKVWNASLFSKPVMPAIDLGKLKGTIDSSKAYVVSHSVETPRHLAPEYGSDTHESVGIGIIEKREMYGDLSWYLVSGEDEKQSTPVWVLYDASKLRVLAAYDINLNLVKIEDTSIMQALKTAGSTAVLRNILGFKSIMETQTEVFSGKRRQALSVMAVKTTGSAGSAQINGKFQALRYHEIKMQRGYRSLGIQVAEGRELVRLLSVDGVALRAGNLPKLGGRIVVGYEMTTAAGVKTRYILSYIAEK